MVQDIVIVGAGVLGLSAAFAIAENLRAPRQITIVAEHHPNTFQFLPHYTSAWAGAHFRPYPSKNESERRDYPLARVTLQRFKDLVKSNPESSVRFLEGVEYFEAPDELVTGLAEGYTEGIDNFRVLEKNQLPEGAVFGTAYSSFVLNPPLYLQFLYRRLKFHYDVKFVTAKLSKLLEATSYATKSNGPLVIINCTGQGLQWDGGYDPKCFGIRGQTLLVNAPSGNGLEGKTVTHQLKDGNWTFFIPRPFDGGFILGGTKQPNDTRDTPSDEDTKQLVERGAKLFPQLMKVDGNGKRYFDIVDVNVGFRPAREGGLNFAVEHHNGNTVINGYGAAGSGYEFSYGIGHKIYEILQGLQSKL